MNDLQPNKALLPSIKKVIQIAIPQKQFYFYYKYIWEIGRLIVENEQQGKAFKKILANSYPLNLEKALMKVIL